MAVHPQKPSQLENNLDYCSAKSAELYGDAVPLPTAILLTQAAKLLNGAFRFAFTNPPGLSFSVFGATNPAVPFSNWVPLTGITEAPPGQYQFTDPQAANLPRRFYRVRSP